MATDLPSDSPRETTCSRLPRGRLMDRRWHSSNGTAETGYDIWALPLSGERRPRPIVQTRFIEAYPDFSPDGHWLAYMSDESGRAEVYVQPYPGPGPRQQVSTNGGTAPAWSHDGRELFYTTTQTVGGQATLTKMMAVPVALRPTFSAGAPLMLFQGQLRCDSGNSRLRRDVGWPSVPDGPAERASRGQRADMILVQNWFEELKTRVPTK